METNVFPTSYFHGKIFNYAQNFYEIEMKWSVGMGEELHHLDQSNRPGTICPQTLRPWILHFRKKLRIYGLTSKKYNMLFADNVNYKKRLGLVRLDYIRFG